MLDIMQLNQIMQVINFIFVLILILSFLMPTIVVIQKCNLLLLYNIVFI